MTASIRPRGGKKTVRLDFLLVIAGVAIIESPRFAVALALAVILHELGHAIAARVQSGDPFRLWLQLGGGGDYIEGNARLQAKVLVMIGGAVGSLLAATIGYGASTSGDVRLAAVGAELAYAGCLWTGFQLMPYPPLDGGILFRSVAGRFVKSATHAWWLAWAIGVAIAAVLAYLVPSLLEPAIWLSGMSFIMGRAEAGYVRHLDAYSAWERQDYPAVVRLVGSAPDSLRADDRLRLYDLGVHAAKAIEDVAAAATFAQKLPAGHLTAIRAGEWLLRQDAASGARLAEQAFDALDAEQVKILPEGREAWADLAFRLAVFEAEQLRPDSALGVLERAIALGYDDIDRLEAEPAFAQVRTRARWAPILAHLYEGRERVQ